MEKNNWISHIEWVIMFVTLIGGFYAIESRFDNCNNRIDQFLVAWREESTAWHANWRAESIAWHQETKDFHGRLCAIEERNRVK